MKNGEFSFWEMVSDASLLVQLVMVFLVILSVASWTIIIQRGSQYKEGRRRADEFEDRFWSGIDLHNLYQDCVKNQQGAMGLEVIYTAGFKEFVRLVNSGPADQDVVMDGTYRQMKVACSREVESLESHLPTLATIGSISPYIGLFGTVWGIMHAFVALAAVKNATLSMVAPPIAEALIATAMGLFAAIPAVMFYNRFVTKVEALENRYLNFMDEFATILNRRLVSIRSELSKDQPSPARATAFGAVPARAAPSFTVPPAAP
nr:protein TolQ [Succinivibrionaceae bacterium]